MQATTLINPNPILHEKQTSSKVSRKIDDALAIDTIDIYDAIRDIRDPEHPYTLEDLNIIKEEDIVIAPATRSGMKPILNIEISPTVPHCTLVYNIALSIRTKLDRVFAEDMNQLKLHLNIKSGTHNDASAVNRQINDKERIAAALENPDLIQLMNKLIEDSSY
jgi:metal-sulfur cluster biosynthetic enzyme